jgi:hypothetical protein
MRRFIRHPTSIPIEIRTTVAPDAPQAYERDAVLDVSLEGLAFHFFDVLDPGSIVLLRIPFVDPVFESFARVVWCHASEPGYKVGAEFLKAQDDFRVRMVEQVCHIESYRQQVRAEEHRELTTEEAAMEWIAKFAAQFPQGQSDDIQ